MPSQPKPKRVGRPALPKGHAKASMLRVRFSELDRKRIEVAAKASNQTVSDWIRATVEAAIG